MNSFQRALSSTVGLKFLVAVTGIILVAFVVLHMLGNLQIFLGPEAINSYAAFLKARPGPLWIMRLGLLAALVVHIVGITRLTLRNRNARPTHYSVKHPVKSTLLSRTMLPTGLVLLFFVLYHLGHFTIGVIHPEYFRMVDSLGRHDVYSMTILGFQEPLISLFYLAAMGLLGMHLGHGVASTLQSMGWRRPRLAHLTEVSGRLIALLVVIGNMAIPLAALTGLIEPMQRAL